MISVKIRRLCERLNNFYNVRPGETWCLGASSADLP